MNSLSRKALGILLQGEVDERTNRRFDRLQKNARFRYRASIEELTYDSSRGLDKALIANLATGEYLEKGESVLITGKTGVGKSFLASALGLQACAQGYSVEYFNAQKMFLRLKMARLEGTILKFFDKLAKTKLLIIDDFGLCSPGQTTTTGSDGYYGRPAWTFFYDYYQPVAGG